jgi:hypothetical protein
VDFSREEIDHRCYTGCVFKPGGLDRALGDASKGRGEPWARLWGRLSDLSERAAAVNLDRADLLVAALADLARTKAMAT